MPVDPCFADLLADRRNELRPPPPHVALADLRAANRTFLLATPRPPVHAIEELSIPSEAGPLTVRVYRPSASACLPATLFCHGGGFVLGDLDTHDALCRELALGAACIVVSIDYRRAPETKFPGAVEDCHAALRWLAAHAEPLRADPRRLALCGDSAGANLAAATLLRARPDGPSVQHLALLYPMTDAACDTPSMQAFARGFVLTQDVLRWFWSAYLGSPDDAAHPLASILRADLTGLPPTTIVTAEFDPLRDEGEALAARMRAAGVPVIARRYLGMIHGFAGVPQITPTASRALQDVAGDLRAALNRS